MENSRNMNATLETTKQNLSATSEKSTNSTSANSVDDEDEYADMPDLTDDATPTPKTSVSKHSEPKSSAPKPFPPKLSHLAKKFAPALKEDNSEYEDPDMPGLIEVPVIPVPTKPSLAEFLAETDPVLKSFNLSRQEARQEKLKAEQLKKEKDDQVMSTPKKP